MELKNKELLKMDLQHFADSGEGEGADEGAGEGAGTGEGDSSKKLELTEEELQRRVESEADRKLDKALAKRQREWEEETDRRIQEALEEKERLSNLSEKERKEEELSQREKEIQERLAEVERKELKSDAMTELSKKDIPADYIEFWADTLLAESAEETLENINTFKEMTDKMLNQMKKEALRQSIPPAGGGSAGGGSKISSLAEARNKQAEDMGKAPNPWATEN